MASGWSLLLHPVQRGVPSKTQSYDDTTDLRNKICSWITKVAAVLSDGRPSQKIFKYRYEDFTKTFEEQHVHWSCKTLFRASAAILVRHWTKRDYTAPCWRSKNGRWKSDNSIARHEKLEDWHRSSPISTKVNQPISEPQTALEEFTFGRHRVEDVFRPSLMMAASS